MNERVLEKGTDLSDVGEAEAMSYVNGKQIPYLILIVILTHLIFTGCDKGVGPSLSELYPTLRRLDTGSRAVFPVWSPDGFIYYIKGGTHTGGDIWVIDADGENARFLKAGKYRDLDICPDGKTLVTIRPTPTGYCGYWGGGDLVLLDVATLEEQVIELERIPAYVLSAKFSPDGERLVFYARFTLEYGQYTSEDGYYAYYLANGKIEFLFPQPDVMKTGDYFNGFDVFDDRIIYRITASASEWPTMVGKIDGSSLVRLYREGVSVRIGSPSFSPDGSKIVGVWGSGLSPPQFGGAEDIVLFSSEGRLIAHVISDETGFDKEGWPRGDGLAYFAFPSWSPDGDKIVFSAAPATGEMIRRGSYSLWVIDVPE